MNIAEIGCADGKYKRRKKKLGVSGLSLAQALTNSLRKRRTSLVMSFVTLYLTVPRFESQNCEDHQKNGVRRWEELLEEEKN